MATKGELVVISNELTTQIKFDKQDLIDVGVQGVLESAKAKREEAYAENKELTKKRCELVEGFKKHAQAMAESHELTASFRKACKGHVVVESSFNGGEIRVVAYDRSFRYEYQLAFSFKNSEAKKLSKQSAEIEAKQNELNARIAKLSNVIDHPAQFERKFKAAMSAQRLKGSVEGAAMLEAITKSAELVAKDL